MNVTFYGHACFGVEINGSKLLFDPFISQNEKANHISIDAIEADYILLSHGHDDHVLDAMKIAKNTEAKIVSNYEIVSWYGAQGLKNMHAMNHGGNWAFDFGNLKYVNAVHSSVLPDGTYGGNPGGFIIETEELSFYYAGDTALTMDMQLIGNYHNVKYAFLPIGDNFTMGIDDAVIAAEFVKCDKVIGMHYDTFGFIEIDHEKARAKFSAKGIDLSLMNIGETRTFE